MQELLVWFLPAAVRRGERDDLRRAQLTVVGCWLAVAITAAIAVLQATWGIWQSALVCAAGSVASAALPFWMRRTGNWRAVGATLCGVVWLAAFSVAVLTGGTMISALYYLVFAPALAVVLLGYRAGIVLAAASTATVAIIYALHDLGLSFPIAPDPEIGMRSAMRGALIFNLALGSLVAAYEWLRGGMLRDNAEIERRYRALADVGPDLIAELDTEGRILYTSAVGGSELASLVGREARTLIHREDQAALTRALRLLGKQRAVRVGPLRWLVSRSDVRWIEASLTRFRNGNERRFLVVARDVTDRVALEAQLRHSQKMQAIGQLSSGLAHDFNNLLMVISGHAEALAALEEGDATACATIREIQRASDQGAALTRRLAALSRPSAISRRTLDLNEVVRDNARMLGVLLGEGILLELALAPGALHLKADSGELEQILVNFVTNARDALPGGGMVRILTHAHADRVALVVQDDGSGIDPAIRERIFEPFFTTKQERHGTGLGLYVVYSIVNDLGGEIELQSDVGRGTRFTVDLPHAEEPVERAPTCAASSGSGGGDERILLVEDRPELRSLICAALEGAGYRLVVAADGVEALALGVAEQIDLVLADVVMPRMDGVTLVTALRERRPDLRVLFMSGHSEIASDRGRIGANDPLLRKPFRMQDLRCAVRDVLDAGVADRRPTGRRG